MTYALILYVLTISGERGYVIDHDLSQADCIALEVEWALTLDDEYSEVICQEEPQ